jgi:hypothetical protein
VPCGIPGNNSGSWQNAVHPGDEAHSPIRCIKTDDTGAHVVEMDGPCQQWLCKRSIMDMCRSKQKEDGESATATEEGLHRLAQ